MDLFVVPRCFAVEARQPAVLSHREIAERLGSSETAVRQLLHRARARLARLLGGRRQLTHATAPTYLIKPGP